MCAESSHRHKGLKRTPFALFDTTCFVPIREAIILKRTLVIVVNLLS